jgi:trehalose synthase
LTSSSAGQRNSIPTDLPLVVQVSRFDKSKDPRGESEACEIVRRTVDCTLVLIASKADDDPEPQPYLNPYRHWQTSALWCSR